MSSPDDADVESGSPADASRDSRGTLRDQLLSFLATVADAEIHGTQRRAGSSSRGRSTVSYEYAVSVGLTPLTERAPEEATEHATRSSPDGGATWREGRTEQRIETRHRGDGEYILVADLPDTGTAAVEAVVDETGSVIQLSMDGAIVDRLSVDRDTTKIRDATVKNGVLTVRLQQTEKP